jgi:hypothetical protein
MLRTARILLRDCAEIIQGAPLEKEGRGAENTVIGLADLGPPGPPERELKIASVSAKRARSAQVRIDDVLVAARGTQFRARVADKHFFNSYATSNLFIVRVRPETIDPHVLVAFLRTTEAQGRLLSSGTSTVGPLMITVRALANLEVPLLTREVQTSLRDFVANYDAAIAVAERQLEKRRQFAGSALEAVFAGGAELGSLLNLEAEQ